MDPATGVGKHGPGKGDDLVVGEGPAENLNRLFIEATYPWGLHYISRMSLGLYPYYAGFALRYAFLFVPGWLRI